MSNALIIRKIIEDLAKEVQDWNVKSSNMHSSDADAFAGDYNWAKEINKENEYDPKTGKLIKNDEIGDYTTYIQQWDADNVGYLEEEDEEPRDNGVGLARIVMQQITPIK
jgi:hypothetical protein